MDTFASRIKTLRTEKAITQIKLGEMLNVDTSTVNKWEKNTYIPNRDILIKLCDYFDCSLDYLMGFSDIRQKPEQILSDMEEFDIFFKSDGKGYKLNPKEAKIARDLIENLKSDDEIK